MNHEYTNEDLMFRGYDQRRRRPGEQVRIAMAAHGGSVVESSGSADTGQWKLVTTGRRRYNRRVTAHTRCRFTGPAAGIRLLRTAADPSGRTVSAR